MGYEDSGKNITDAALDDLQALIKACERDPELREEVLRKCTPADLEKAKEWAETLRPPTSMHQEIDEEGTMLGDLFESELPGPEHYAELADLQARVRAAMADCLRPREREALELVFGFDDGNAHTLAAAGKLMGVTRERVRQIKDDAMGKLRAAHPELAQYLPEEIRRETVQAAHKLNSVGVLRLLTAVALSAEPDEQHEIKLPPLG